MGFRIASGNNFFASPAIWGFAIQIAHRGCIATFGPLSPQRTPAQGPPNTFGTLTDRLLTLLVFDQFRGVLGDSQKRPAPTLRKTQPATTQVFGLHPN